MERDKKKKKRKITVSIVTGQVKEEGGHSCFRGWLSRDPLLVCFSTAEKNKELIWMSLQGII